MRTENRHHHSHSIESTSQWRKTELVSAVAAAMAAVALGMTSAVVGAEEINHSSPIKAAAGETVNLGKAGDIINITTGPNHTEPWYTQGIVADPGRNKASGGQFVIGGETLNINVNVTEDGIWANGIMASNATTPESSAGHDFEKAKVVIDAENTFINAKSENNTAYDASIALNAMSEGTIEVNGNLKATAKTVVTTRGDSFIKVNASKTKHVELDGDISFNYDGGNSGTGVNSNVLLNLTDETSYWNGQSLVSWDSKPGDQKLVVQNFELGLANGGTWKLTGESFVNVLNLAGGHVETNGHFVEVTDALNVTGDTTLVNLAADSTVSTKVAEENFYNISGLAADTIHAQKAVNLDAGTLTITGTFKPVDVVTTVKTGATLKADRMDLTQAGADTVKLAGGTLESGYANLFDSTDKLIADKAANVTHADETTKVKDYIQGDGGTLAVNDKGVYTVESLGLMSEAAKKEKLTMSFVNATLAKTDPNQNSVLVDGIVQEQEKADVAAGSVVDGKATVTVGGTTGAATVVVKSDGPDAVTGVEVTAQSSSGARLVLVGSAEGGALVQNEAGDAIDVNVGANATLALGADTTARENKGEVTKVTLANGAAMTVSNMTATVGELTAGTGSTVTIGHHESEKIAKVVIEKLTSAADSLIMVDPVWGPDGYSDASSLVVADHAAIDGTIVAGQASFVSFGMTEKDARTAFDNLGLTLKQGETEAAVFLGNKLTLGTTGRVVANGALNAGSDSSAITAAGQGGKLTVADKAALIVDNRAMSADTALTGTVAVETGAPVKTTLGIVNAREGEYKLADTVEGTFTSIVTDSRFVNATLAGGMLTNTVDTTGLGDAVASMGLQSSILNAGRHFAQVGAKHANTVSAADGLGLWVDVGGEAYRQGKGAAQYKADTGYGMFGADVRVTDTWQAGAALGYADGSLRADASSLKNKTSAWGLSLYGAWDAFANTRVVFDAAYWIGENDISGQDFRLSANPDTSLINAGVTVNGAFDIGGAMLRPFAGVRASWLETDAFAIDGIAFDKEKATLFEVPLGVTLEARTAHQGGWDFRPAASLLWVPTFGDTDVKVHGEDFAMIDKSPVRASLGLTAQSGTLTIEGNVRVGTGAEDARSLGADIGLSYRF